MDQKSPLTEEEILEQEEQTEQMMHQLRSPTSKSKTLMRSASVIPKDRIRGRKGRDGLINSNTTYGSYNSRWTFNFKENFRLSVLNAKDTGEKYDLKEESEKLIKDQKKWDKIVSNFERYFNDKKKIFKEYVYKGISRPYRGTIWGSILLKNIEPELLDTVEEIWEKTDESIHATQIRKDVERTQNALSYGNINESARQPMLFRILNAYSTIDPEIGYTQGMNEVAAFLLKYMTDKDAFYSLVALNLGKKHQLRGMYTDNFPLLKYFNSLLIKQLSSQLDPLLKHFNNITYDVTMITTKWFLCLFVQSLPDDLLERVWDIMIFDGPITIISIAVALLFYHKEHLLKLDMEKTAEFFQVMIKSPEYKIEKIIKRIKKTTASLVESGVQKEFSVQITQISSSPTMSLMSDKSGASSRIISTFDEKNTSKRESTVKHAKSTFRKSKKPKKEKEKSTGSKNKRDAPSIVITDGNRTSKKKSKTPPVSNPQEYLYDNFFTLTPVKNTNDTPPEDKLPDSDHDTQDPVIDASPENKLSDPDHAPQIPDKDISPENKLSDSDHATQVPDNNISPENKLSDSDHATQVPDNNISPENKLSDSDHATQVPDNNISPENKLPDPDHATQVLDNNISPENKLPDPDHGIENPEKDSQTEIKLPDYDHVTQDPVKAIQSEIIQ